ncbi:MAG: hypothetical protein INQ03_19955 [Candidatus Heimdallarchaeota archaeon]|nr:hypothetical protein [Candidatus Heimdallarchaeota archaeon]
MRIILVLFIFSILLFTSPADAQSDEQNDAGSGGDAPYNYPHPQITFDVKYYATIGTLYTEYDGGEDQRDCYDLKMYQQGELQIELSIEEYGNQSNSNTLNLDLYYIGDSDLIARFKIDEKDNSQIFKINIILVEDILFLFSSSSAYIRYSFKLTFIEGLPNMDQNDANSNTDASFYQKVSINIGETYKGHIGNNYQDLDGSVDNEDYYEYYIDRYGFLYFNVSINSKSTTFGMIYFSVFYYDDDFDKSYEMISISEIIDNETPYTFRTNINEIGIYWFLIKTEISMTYTFNSLYKPYLERNQNDMGSDGDAPSTLSQARKLEINTFGTGIIGPDFMDYNNESDTLDSFVIFPDFEGSLILSMKINLIEPYLEPEENMLLLVRIYSYKTERLVFYREDDGQLIVDITTYQ